MKLMEVLKLLNGKYILRVTKHETLRQVRFTDHKYHFILTPTPNGIRLDVYMEGKLLSSAIITGKDKDLSTYIEHLSLLEDEARLDSYYSSMECERTE